MPGHQRNRAPHRCGPRACPRDRTRRPASRRRSRRVLQQRGDQRIGRSEPPAAQLRRDDRFHGLQLCRRVHAQIDFRGADIGVPEPQGDLSHVMRGLKHDHGATVPQLMRRYGNRGRFAGLAGGAGGLFAHPSYSSNAEGTSMSRAGLRICAGRSHARAAGPYLSVPSRAEGTVPCGPCRGREGLAFAEDTGSPAWRRPIPKRAAQPQSTDAASPGHAGPSAS